MISLSPVPHLLRIQSMELLAYSVLDLFPNTILVEGKVSNVDFWYDFIFEKPLTEQAIPLIEERWRKTLKEFPGFEILEMMRENAASLFQYHGQPFKADEVLSQESNTVTLIQLDRFYDTRPQGMGIIEEKAYPKVFSYLTYRKEDLLITRLEAGAFLEQIELKTLQKLRKNKEKLDHITLGKELDLFYCEHGEWVFTPRGQALKDAVSECVAQEAKLSGYYPVSFSSDKPLLTGSSRFGVEGITFFGKANVECDVNKGLLEPSVNEFFRIYISEEERILPESCISSLQFIQKIIKIFDLNHEWVLRCYRPREVSKKKWQTQLDLLKFAAEKCDIHYCSSYNSDTSPPRKGDCYPRIELGVYDALGRRWTVSSIYFANCENKDILVIDPLVSLERFIALLLEQTAGKIPAWLQPEQVRIVPIAKEYREMAKATQRVLASHNIRAGLDIGFDKLTEKIRLGVHQQVPYIIVVGDEEEKNGFVAVRRLGQEQVSKMKLEDFIPIAKQELKREFES